MSRGIINTDDVEVQAKKLTLPEFGEYHFDEIEIVQPKEMMSAAEEAAFMEEPVVINIQASENRNAATFEYVGHQGISQYIRRGIDQCVKRKFVYSLLAAKATQYACDFGKNGSREFNVLNGQGKVTHGITLRHDPNPRGGMKWFSEVQSNA